MRKSCLFRCGGGGGGGGIGYTEGDESLPKSLILSFLANIMSVVCTRMYSHVLVCYSYVPAWYSYVTRM